jgi:hypothetical protein
MPVSSMMPASLAAEMLFLASVVNLLSRRRPPTYLHVARAGRAGRQPDSPVDVVQDVHDNDHGHEPQVDLPLQLGLGELAFLWRHARNKLGCLHTAP